MDRNFIRHLEYCFEQPLPGEAAQFQMAHISRASFNGDVPDDAKPAGVLALFYPSGENWQMVLIERVSHNPHDRHRGQISFPGGGAEIHDKSLANTALRETEEEIGVPASQVRLLGALSPLYIPVSNFKVHPFVGFVEHSPVFQPEPGEVHAILEVPFSRFLNPHHRGITSVSVAQSVSIPNVPYFDVFGKVVWGATAMILNELITLVGHTPRV